MWLNIGLSWKQNGVMRILVIFMVDLCSAISFKRSGRELSIDLAELRPILKYKGLMRILVIFRVDLCSAISFKGLGESFPLMLLN